MQLPRSHWSRQYIRKHRQEIWGDGSLCIIVLYTWEAGQKGLLACTSSNYSNSQKVTTEEIVANVVYRAHSSNQGPREYFFAKKMKLHEIMQI